jgi:hypothetical protein
VFSWELSIRKCGEKIGKLRAWVKSKLSEIRVVEPLSFIWKGLKEDIRDELINLKT